MVGMAPAAIPCHVQDRTPLVNSRPQVSVILAAHNAERTLGEAIESVLEQTLRDLELIVCDDASTDGTSTVLAAFDDRRLRVLRNPENMGPGRSRDRAIEVSRGTWLAMIDADDRWARDRLSILLDAGGGRKNVMVFDDIMESHDTPSGLVPWRRLRGSVAFLGDGTRPVDVPLELLVRERRWLIKPLIPAQLIRRHAIKHTARKVHEDNQFFLCCVACGATLLYVPVALYYYRITPGSATSSLERSQELREVITTMRARWPDRSALQRAFNTKLSSIGREERYRPFLVALKSRKLTEMVFMGCQEPWLVREMIGRVYRELPYHIHRIMHGGRVRGIR